MHVRLMFENEYLSAADLRGKPVTLTISRVVQEELQVVEGPKELKYVVYFEEMEERHKRDPKRFNKRLVLNKTNGMLIASVHGNEADNWPGKKITLYATTCKAFGEVVDCIRIRGAS